MDSRFVTFHSPLTWCWYSVPPQSPSSLLGTSEGLGLGAKEETGNMLRKRSESTQFARRFPRLPPLPCPSPSSETGLTGRTLSAPRPPALGFSPPPAPGTTFQWHWTQSDAPFLPPCHLRSQLRLCSRRCPAPPSLSSRTPSLLLTAAETQPPALQADTSKSPSQPMGLEPPPPAHVTSSWMEAHTPGAPSPSVQRPTLPKRCDFIPLHLRPM